MLKNNNLCNNCGKHGHSFHQCKLPITSYGIIVFKKTNEGIKYLMIRRRNSFGYIDFIRGKYSLTNIEQIEVSVDEMSVIEKKMILENTFEYLWKDMWGEPVNNQFKTEEITSGKKFEILKNGIQIGDKLITLENIITNSSTSWEETEWEFPKGRRNHLEKDLTCALREFEEETGIPQKNIQVIENVLPFEEIFIGSNHKSYKHKYFLAYLEDECEEDNNLTHYQKTEVSKLEWKTLDECLKSIRPYNLEKKQLIININKVLQEYRLYS